jgi:hypothetical protein
MARQRPAFAPRLATWLNGQGDYQRTLDAIPLERVLQTSELFLQHLDALGGLGRWAEIKQLLDSERYPLDPVIQKMYLAAATCSSAKRPPRRTIGSARSKPRTRSAEARDDRRLCGEERRL